MHGVPHCVCACVLVATTHCGNALASGGLEEGSVQGRGRAKEEGGSLERRTVCTTDMSVG